MQNLRIFGAFAVNINLIFLSLKGSFSYLIILGIGMCGFANAMFILAMLERPDNADDKVTGPNIFTAVMYSFSGYLYKEKEGKKLKNEYIFAIFKVFYDIIFTTIMLKVLICILHHIFHEAEHAYEGERLKTKCNLIIENEILFGRKKLFKDAKYIMRAQLEQVEH